MYSFGSGVLLGTRTDVANATPTNFGLVQEVQLDISFSQKELYGQFQVPVAIARGTAKFTGKAKLARISGMAFNNLFFGQSLVSGQLATAFGEAATVPASPFQYTVVNAGSFVDDYGVLYASSGLPLTKVASAPAVGQYSVSTGGVYTFNTADSGKGVLVSYTYTVAASGQQVIYANQLLGYTPTFQAQLYTTFQGQPLNLKLFNCTSTKLGFATKIDDFVVPELDFSIYANAAGNVFQWAFGEVS